MAVATKSDVVKQAEQVAVKAIKASQPIHHIFRSITENPAAVADTARGAVTAANVDETLAVWISKGYELFNTHALNTFMAGLNKTIPVTSMLYILKRK